MFYKDFRSSNSSGGKTECLQRRFLVNSRKFSLWLPVVRAQAVETTDPVPAEVKTENVPAPKSDIIVHKYTPLPDETGWDRIKGLYSTSIYGELGPEWSAIRHGTVLGLVTGGIFGGVIGATNARIKYLDRNEGTLYTNEMAARRALQDKITVGMFSGGFQWGWRVAAFTALYIGTVTHLSVYFNETRWTNFVIAGAASGGLFKFMQGPRAALTASVLGSTLGLIAGGLSMAVCKWTGYSLEELRYYHYQVYTLRKTEVPEFRKSKEKTNADSSDTETAKQAANV
ncbi:hypothetical protein CHUAL_002932 [Chamberlinius hualienensis]